MKLLTILEQADNNQFTFYDNKLGTILREFEGFEYPQVNESIDDVAGPYGSVYVFSKYGKRQVSIKGDLLGSNVYALRRQLMTALRQTGTIKLVKFITYDDLELQFEAEVTKMVNPYTHMIHTFLIEMIAPDWRFYSQTEKNFDIPISIVNGGGAIPMSIPFALTESVVTDVTKTKIVTNEGSEVTDPIFTIHGAGTDILVRNNTSDKEFTIDLALNDTDELVIDVKNRTVVLNGITNAYQYITGDFWSLVPGENEIRFYVDGYVNDETNLTITYRDAYGGI